MRITVTDWAFNEIVFKGIHGFIPWGKTILCKGNEIEVFSAIECEIIKETEKAIQIKFPYGITNNHCDIIRTIDWKVWIPKKCVLCSEKETKYNYEFLTFCDFGIYPRLKSSELLPSYESDGYTIKKKW